MKRVLFFLFALTAVSPAAAQGPPRYDPEKWCDQVAESGGSRSEMIYGGCIDQEQEAYDRLKAVWPSLPNKIQKWCNEVAHSGEGASYVILGGCIEQELDAKRVNSGKSFRF